MGTLELLSIHAGLPITPDSKGAIGTAVLLDVEVQRDEKIQPVLQKTLLCLVELA